MRPFAQPSDVLASTKNVFGVASPPTPTAGILRNMLVACVRSYVVGGRARADTMFARDAMNAPVQCSPCGAAAARIGSDPAAPRLQPCSESWSTTHTWELSFLIGALIGALAVGRTHVQVEAVRNK